MTTLARPQDVADIMRRLRNVRPDIAPRWGRMSAHQMICHVSDALRMAMGERPVSPATGPVKQTILKWMALYVPLPWPAAIPTRPEIDQEARGTKPLDFARDLAQLESLVERLTTQQMESWPAHPIFGRMSQQAWLRWAYLHTDHHLRQFRL